MRTYNLPSIDELEIPDDVQPGPGWTEQMLEMAAHIGPYATLLIVDRYGGEVVYIAADPSLNKLRELIGPEKATIMSHVYRRERLQIPTAKYALRHARRRGVLAAARARRLTLADAARILGTSRSYMSHLVNKSDEGLDSKPMIVARKFDPHQMDMFED